MFVSMRNADTVTLRGVASVMSVSAATEFPIVNAPAGMNTMPVVWAQVGRAAVKKMPATARNRRMCF